ncbi:MAG: insulinase family protein [Ignavibacteriaceae bacterium]|nr:insulinase family protein [Ignavibacteriaceae bacterium]
MSFDRSIKPLQKDEINFSLPNIEHFVLSNGLKVLHVKKTSLPIIRLNLLFYAGSRFDPADKKGLANLFGMVADEGAGKYDALALSDELDTLGTSLSINRDNDSIYYSLQTLTEHYEKSLDLFCDVLLLPMFDESAFAREQRKILTRILQSKDSPDELADFAFEKILYGSNNPYAHPVFGFEDSVAKITTEDIKNFYKKYIIPSNGFLVSVGDITSEALKNSLEKRLNNWKAEHTVNFPAIISKEAEPKIYLLHKEGTVQSEIRCGHLTGNRNEKDYFPKSILNMILGGQFTSRINLNLRENKGYTYGALSRFNYQRDAAHFYVSTSVGVENTANAIIEIDKELRNIREGVTTEELDFTKSSMIRKFPSNFETLQQISVNLIGKVIYNLKDDFFNTYIESVNSITKNDVDEAAVNNIYPDINKYIIAGDKNLLLPQFKNISFAGVVEINLRGEIIEA